MKRVLTFFCLLFYFAAFSQIKVVDGDTFWYNNEKIRIKNIDCPELSSKMGIECKLFAETLLKRAKRVDVIRFGIDKYGRTLATVYLDGRDMAYWMISEGYTFVYDYYNDNTSYKESEIAAKKKKLGIHKYNLVKPWKWRN